MADWNLKDWLETLAYAAAIVGGSKLRWPRLRKMRSGSLFAKYLGGLEPN